MKLKTKLRAALACILALLALILYTLDGVRSHNTPLRSYPVRNDFPSEEEWSVSDLTVQTVNTPNGLSAKAAAVIEAQSGRVLFAENADTPMPMASTTKIMTALLAIELGRLDETVTIPAQAQGVEGSSIWLSAGEHMTLRELLYGLMLSSGNDAATAIAIHIGGSVEDFLRLMNERAAQIGCEQTRFANPHGLPAENHYTTALELAKIMAVAMQYPEFEALVSTKKATIPWEGHPWKRSLTNKNRLLSEYEGCNGGKTGYTKQAGRCLVAAARRDGMQLVSVVLSAPDWFNDCAQLMDNAFSQYGMRVIAENTQGRIPVIDGRNETVEAVLEQPLILPVDLTNEADEALVECVLPPYVTAPLTRGDELGCLVVTIGEQSWTLPLVAATDVAGNGYHDWFRKILESLFSIK